MMKVNKSKIWALVLALTLILGSLSVLSVSADGEDTAFDVNCANIAYDDMLKIVFTLKNTDTLPAGAVTGVLMWDEAKDEYTYENASFKTFTSYTDGESEFYVTRGVAACDIGTVYRFAAAYRHNGEVVIADVFEYSIAKYVASRFSDGNATENQKELYDNLLAYGLASDTVLEDDSYAVIKTVAEGIRETVVSFGEAVTLTAPEIEGKTFEKWVDAEGNTVAEELTLTLETVEIGKIVTYTAVYN